MELDFKCPENVGEDKAVAFVGDNISCPSSCGELLALILLLDWRSPFLIFSSSSLPADVSLIPWLLWQLEHKRREQKKLFQEEATIMLFWQKKRRDDCTNIVITLYIELEHDIDPSTLQSLRRSNGKRDWRVSRRRNWGVVLESSRWDYIFLIQHLLSFLYYEPGPKDEAWSDLFSRSCSGLCKMLVQQNVSSTETLYLQ